MDTFNIQDPLTLLWTAAAAAGALMALFGLCCVVLLLNLNRQFGRVADRLELGQRLQALEQLAARAPQYRPIRPPLQDGLVDAAMLGMLKNQTERALPQKGEVASGKVYMGNQRQIDG